MPTASALNQQRAKLKPDALEAVFKHFNSSVMKGLPAPLDDGGTVFWLLMVPPARFSVPPIFLLMITSALLAIPFGESTVCI